MTNERGAISIAPLSSHPQDDVNKLKNLLLTTALLSASLAVFASAPASAASGNDFSIAPATTPGAQAPRAYFDYDVSPGQVIDDKVSIINRTDTNLNLNVYAADAYNVPLDGSFALHLLNEKRTDVGLWTTLPIQNLNVPAHSQSTFPFSVHIPANARPGDHAGGIVAVNTAQSVQQQGSARVAVNKAVGSRMYLRVKGTLHAALDVTNLHVNTSTWSAWPLQGGKGARITYTLVNSGNVRLDGTATLSVKDVWGRTVKSYAPKKLTSVLPGQKITVTERWSHVPALPLRLSPHVTIHAGQLQQTRGGAPTYVIPWLLLALIVGAAAGWRRWRQRRKPAPPPVAPPAQRRHPVAV